MTKVAILFDRFGPYHVARLEAAAQVCTTTGIELFGESKEYEWDRIEGEKGFQRMTLFPGMSSLDVSRRQLTCATYNALNHLSPDVVVIPGWTHVAAIAALSWCCKHKVPRVVLSESTAWDEPRQYFKEFVKRNIIKLFSSGLVGGDPHKRYLAALGMPEDRIFLGYDVIANDYFKEGVVQIKNIAQSYREREDLPKNYFLASARFVEKKNLFRLLEAYAEYRNSVKELFPEKFHPDEQDNSTPWSLILLGDGELRKPLTDLLTKLDLQGHVHMPGFKQYDELPLYYGLAKVFIHASTTEQWGLVVNEAMAAGLPVLVSRSCGCAENLVSESLNGFTFDPMNVADISRHMLEITMVTEAQRLKMGDRSREIIADWGPTRFAQGLGSAVQTAINSDIKQPTLFDRLILFSMRYR